MIEENKKEIGTGAEQDPAVEQTREFLCSYQACLDMLNLRRYERRRARGFGEEFDCSDILMGNEAYWRARMYEVESLIGNLKNGREKLVLYYHYMRGESIERAADLLGVSRRTGYRIHKRALWIASVFYRKQKREAAFPDE